MLRKRPWSLLAVTGAVVLSLLLSACGGSSGSDAVPAAGNHVANESNGDSPVEGNTNPDATLSGNIVIDGSSTVAPISEAVAEEFMKLHPGVRVTVGTSGTGGGFKKWVKGETDINDASRPIKDSEKEEAATLGIEPLELMVAYDGLSVVVNKQNDFVQCLTVEELKRIWEPGSTVTTWADVRPEWPAEKIALYGPGTDSGTFEYFTEAIVGEAMASRSDYTASEDDNLLVRGVSGDTYSLGYFGFAYYENNADTLKLVAIDAGGGCIAPSTETINNGTYAPLSRPVFIYPSTQAASRPEVKEFLKFYLTEGRYLVGDVGYIPLPDSLYEDGLAKLP